MYIYTYNYTYTYIYYTLKVHQAGISTKWHIGDLQLHPVALCWNSPSGTMLIPLPLPMDFVGTCGDCAVNSCSNGILVGG